MKCVYRNKKTKGIVELAKPRAEFEESENWERIEGEAPDPSATDGAVEVDTGDDGELSLDEAVSLICDNLGDFEDHHIERLNSAIGEEAKVRAVPDPGVAEARSDEGEAERQASKASEPTKPAVEAKEDKTPSPDEPNATKAAADLAKKEGLDLSKIKGSGEDGQVLIGDVRSAVEAKED